MMRRLKIGVFVALAVVASPAAFAGSEPGGHAVAVVYHRFGEDAYPATNTTLAQLDAHIAYLKDGRFNVWPLRRIVDALQTGEPIPDRTVAITIDDAYASVAAHALPRLKAAGLTATVFVSTKPIDEGARGFMSWDDIRKAVADGFDIGGHSVSHSHMVELTAEEVKRELADSNARYQAELGFQPPLFAYPYGEASAPVRAAVIAAGYRAAFGQHSGAMHATEDRYYLPRFALNEKYGAMARFRILASAKSMEARDVTPRDMTLGAESNPPAFGFTVGRAVGDLSALACYDSRGSKLRLQRLGGRRIEARLPSRLAPGRHRINCTAPAGGGRWRWFGRQFYVPRAAG